ncbi:MAG TPA: MFS transporter, partial [Trinickia sp.]|uniref:MFS transporter n=1 Tax=Trinickia sp. TaxID=2571163 RepID=UPI002B580E87
MNMRQRLWGIFSGSIGNLIEFYDWFVYVGLEIYFSKEFFPADDPTISLLKTAAVFAIGFLVRPIGGWVLGIYADRHGRRAALLISVSMMCFGSLMIGLTPGYQTIGIAAPVVLLLARILQGLSIGGEGGSAAAYLSETAPKGQRGFYSSFLYTTISLGQLLAMGTLVLMQQFFLTPEQLQNWGWRIPFLIGALISVVGILLRRNMQETESFRKHEKGAKKVSAFREALRHKKACLMVFGLTLGGSVGNYAYAAYMQKFLVNSVGMPKTTASLISVLSLIGFTVLQPVYGALSDRIGRRPLLLTFGVLGTFGTVPLFTFLKDTHSPLVAFFAVMAALGVVAMYSSVSTISKAELFPVEVRTFGLAVPYAVSVSVFSGTVESIALWTRKIGHESWFFW